MERKRNVRKVVALMLTLAMMLSMSMTAFAATTSYGPYSTSSVMSISLPPGGSGTTNSVKISCSVSITVTKIKVSATTYYHYGNPMILRGFNVTAPSGNTYYIPVSSGNSGTIYISGEPSNGNWYVSADVECLTGTYTGYSAIKYKPTSLTFN